MLYTLTAADITAEDLRDALSSTQDIRRVVKANATGAQAEGLSIDEAKDLRVTLAHYGHLSYIWQELS